MKFKSLIIGLVTPLVMLGLVSCGGDGTSSTQEGNPNGNIKFSVANGVSQDFTSVSITTDSSNTNLYSGPFSCPSANTCSLTIAANTKEGYTVLFYNADGDLVGAWTSSSPPASFTSINASATHFGAYLFGQLDKANPEENHLSVAEVNHYFSKSNAAAIAQGQTPDFFLNLKMDSDTYFAATGAQSATGYYQQLQASLDKGEILATPLSSASASPVKAKIIVAASPVIAAAPTPKCSATTKGAAAILGGAAGAVAGWGGQSIDVTNKIVDNIPYLGAISKGIAALFGAACDDTENRFQAIFDQLDSLKAQLTSLQTGLDNVQNSINAIQNTVSLNQAKTSFLEIQTIISDMDGVIASYQKFVGPQKGQYASLVDFFAQTGGLDNASMVPGSNKNGIQAGAIKLISSLDAQRKLLTDIAQPTRFDLIKTNLNNVCATDPGMINAVGDFLAIRKACNNMIISLLVQITAYQGMFQNMLIDELNVLEVARLAKLSAFGNPFKGETVALQKEDVRSYAQAALTNVTDGLPATYGLMDGFPILQSIANKDLGCSRLIFNLEAKSFADGVSYQPNISAWYSGPNTPWGPYVVANCSNGSQTTYSKFYYTGATAARNVMGVLVGSEVSYTSGRLTQAYRSSVKYRGAEPGDYDYSVPGRNTRRSPDFIDIKAPSSITVNNQTPFCGGTQFCTLSDQNKTGPGKQNFALTPKDGRYSSVINMMDNSINPEYAYAVMGITDTAADANGRRFSYLLGYVYSLNIDINRGSGNAEEFHNHQFSCLTADCTILGDQLTIQFKNGAKSDGTGPAVNMSQPSNGHFIMQIN